MSTHVTQDPATEAVLLVLQRAIDGQLYHAIRSAVLGGEAELHDLLRSIPRNEMTGEETDLKIQAWIAMVKLEIVLRQRKEGFICETSHLDEFVRKVIGAVQIVSDGSPAEDFFPSRIFLSASVRLLEAQRDNVETSYTEVSRLDPAIERHPWLKDDSPTAAWFSRGRSTPVPKVLRPRQITLPPIPPAPITLPARPRLVNQAETDGPPNSPSPPDTPRAGGRKRLRSPAPTSRTSRSRSRGRTTKKNVPKEGSDSSPSPGSPPPKRKNKGRADSQGPPPSQDTRLTIKIPLPTTGPVKGKDENSVITHPSLPASSALPTPCTRCLKLRLECVASHMHACQPCRDRKVKCSLTPENWRESGLNHPPKKKRSAAETAEAPKPRSQRAQSRGRKTPRPPSVGAEVATFDALGGTNMARSGTNTQRDDIIGEPVPHPPVHPGQRMDTNEQVDLLRRMDELEKERGSMKIRVQELEALAAAHAAALESQRLQILALCVANRTTASSSSNTNRAPHGTVAPSMLAMQPVQVTPPIPSLPDPLTENFGMLAATYAPYTPRQSRSSSLPSDELSSGGATEAQTGASPYLNDWITNNVMTCPPGGNNMTTDTALEHFYLGTFSPGLS